MMKIYGTMPINPWNEFFIIAGIIFVVSFIAVGENNMNTPILQIRSNKTKGIILSRIEATLVKYFWSNFGPQA